MTKSTSPISVRHETGCARSRDDRRRARARVGSEIKDHKVLQWAVAYLGAALAIAKRKRSSPTRSIGRASSGASSSSH